MPIDNELSVGYMERLARTLGASEPALRLLLSILFGYPLAYIYRKYIYNQNKLLNHLFIIVCGVVILLFNYGSDIYHSITAIFVSYILISILRGNALIATSFTFHMMYLLIGYYYTGTDTYDIKWTMPHCVLTLRLIGLSFDVSDGQRRDDQLSSEQKKSCIRRVPGIFEVFAYALFPASILVGPQFPFRRYESFINKEWDQHTGFVWAGLTRGSIGLGYLALHQIGSMTLPDDYMLTDEFANRSILWRWMYMGLWGKFVLYKYISCWLLSEGAATCFGLTFVGMEDGKENWGGCSNIRLVIFENAQKFQAFVTAFNVNTNHWIAEYIYKRLKFLGNRYISHGAALLFLAVWHGFHSGYYMCFLMEFIVINTEKQIITVLERNEKFMKFIRNPIVSIFVFILLKFYTLVGMGFCLIPFVFLSYAKWWHIFKVVWFYGFILWFPGPVYRIMLQSIFPPTQRKND